jgi:hypothetical protein
MSNSRPRKDHGPRLAAYLRAQLASVWETSSGDVSIESMRDFGNALGLKLGQVLIIAGYGTEADFDGATAPEPPAPVVDVDLAIDADPDLSDFQRRMLRDMLAGMRAVESGQAAAAEIKTATPRKRGGRRK